MIASYSKQTILFLLLLLVSGPTAFAATETAGQSQAAVRIPESPLNFGLDLQYGLVNFDKYRFNETIQNSKAANSAHITFEWLPVQSAGKLGIGLGTAGIFGPANVDLGGGRFASLRPIPLEAFLSYRFDYSKRQIVVPFVRFGGNVTWVKQTSKTGGEKAGTSIYRGFDYALGLQISLSAIDELASRNLDRTVGINLTFLVLEYARSTPIGSSNTADLSYEAFRAGLRFEM